MLQKIKKYWLYIALVLVFLLPADMPAQLMNGYEYSYDNGSSSTTGNGNRTKRTYKLVLLKSTDSSRTVSALGNFDIQIFPNPTKGNLTLSIANLGKEDKVQISLYDFSGNNLFSSMNKDEKYTIDLNKHPNGTYFLTVLINEQSETFKIMKME